MSGFAEQVFGGHRRLSNQLLQIFLVESIQGMDDDIAYNNLRTFIFQRNPELALLIYPNQLAVKQYFSNAVVKLMTKDMISFDNFNSLFISE